MKALKLFLFISFFGLNTVNAFTYTGVNADSAKYKWVKGQKYLLHKVQAKETWISVSKKYNLSISYIMKANLGVIDLKTGQILNIPLDNITALPVKTTTDIAPVKEEPKSKTAILYTVRSNETLFGIAKKFDTSVELIKKWNNIQNDNVLEGQKLVVSYMYSKINQSVKQDSIKKESDYISAKPKSDTIKKVSIVDESSEILKEKKQAVEPKVTVPDKQEKAISSEMPVKKAEQTVSKPIKNSPEVDINENPTRTLIPVGKGAAGKTLMQVSESGICSWITDGDVNQNKFYALHRSTPIGTIIKVINKMNGRYVFVKVVGVLPNTGDNEKSIIKISQAAVNKLGALDAHFQVELSYGLLQ